MGFSISWIGFKALSKAEVLGRVGFCEADSGAGLYQSPGKSRFSVSELPTGWTIVYSKDVAYGSAAHLAGLSTGSMVVACQVEEHAMFSAAHSYQDTRELWSVWHDSQRGARDLSTRGVLPPEFAAIRDRLGAKQDEGSGLWASGRVDPKNPLVAVLKRAGTRVEDLGDRWMPVDYIFDIPVELAAALTGYRHDRLTFDWGEPQWTSLDRI
ncbi:MAG: hypothetical protein ACLQJR_32705 [Stellaceae bacterium]